MMRWTGAALISLSVACRAGGTPASKAIAAAEPATSTPADQAQAVQIEMRNVRLHIGSDEDRIVLDVKALRGKMVSTARGQAPVFDDPQSYVLDVADGEVAIDMASLSHLMNRRIFNYPGAPLSDISIEANGGRLRQRGKLHKGVTVPFSMNASVSATADGRMRLHAESFSALKIPAKKLLDLFGLSLDDVVSMKQRRGIAIEGDDVVIAAGQVLPPPELEGRLTRVAVTDGMLRQTFGSGAPARLAPADARAANYIYFGGSIIRFGKLTMSQADLMLIDADAADPFDFFPALYNAQLVAGYSKNTPSGGLRTYMPDFDDLRAGTDIRPHEARSGHRSR